MLSRYSSGIPQPVSETLTTTSLFSLCTETLTEPPRRLYLTAFSIRLNTSRYISASLPVITTLSQSCSIVISFWLARGVRSVMISSTRGASSIRSERGAELRLLISRSVCTSLESLSSCSACDRTSSAVSPSRFLCSAAKSSSFVCIIASGVRSSCAAFPENWRCVANDSESRSSIRFTETLSCRNSFTVSSLSRMSEMLSWSIFSAC